MAPGGVPGDEQAGRVAVQLADVVVNPFQSAHGVVQPGREDVGGGQPVADADETDAGLVEHWRHKCHPLLVAAGPAAAVNHDEHVAVGVRRWKVEHALVGVRAVVVFGAADFRGFLQDVAVVVPGEVGYGFLWGVVLRFHGA